MLWLLVWQRAGRHLEAVGGLMGTLARYLGLTGFFGAVFLRKLMQYRVDFLLGATGFLISVLTRTLFIYLVFRQVDHITGWRYHEILFLFGFSLLPRGLDHLFADQLWELGRKLVQQGDFYKYLIRPINPLFHLLSKRFFYPDSLGEIVADLGLMLYALQQMEHTLSAAQWALLPLLVLCGAVIYTAIKLRSVAMLAMHFGHPDPEMRSHDATALGSRYVLRPPRRPTAAGRHGSHNDLTARCVGCCARRRAPIAGSSARRFAPSMPRRVFATLAFWTVSSMPVMNTAYQLSSFVKYPLDIFDEAVRFVLTWCLPFTFAAYMPVPYLLRNDTSMLLWTPLIAVLAFATAYRFWLIGIAHHETTGS